MLDELLGQIYSSVTRPGRMTEVLDCVGKQFGADSSFLFTSHSDTEPDAMLLGHHFCPGAVDEFASYWHTEDVWAHAAAQRNMMKRDVVVIGEELVPGRDLYKSKFYNGFGKQHGMHHMLGSVLFDGTERHTQTPFTNLCWYRQAGREQFESADKQALVGLLPHLQNALALQRQLQRVKLNRVSVNDMGERLSVATLLIDAALKIVDHNAIGERLLRGKPALIASVNNSIRSIGTRSSPPIEQALTQCRQSGCAIRMLVQQSCGTLLRATLAALPAETITYAGEFPRPYFLLMIEMAKDDSDEIMERASTLFNLTAAERAVATGLLKGMSIQQIADQRSIAITTARTQLRGVLQKSGFQRQVDLVRALSRLIT